MPKSPNPQVQAALDLFKRGRFKDALARAQAALARGKIDPVLLDITAKSHYQLGDKKEAERCLKRLLKLRPKDSANWVNLGVLQAEAGRLGQAIGSFERAATIDPANQSALNNISRMALELGTPERAEASLSKLKNANPDSEAVPRSLAQHLLKAGRSEDALAVLRAAALQNPKSATVQNDLGVALAQTGQDATALAHFEAADRLSPGTVATLENLGSLYVRLGRMEEARPKLEAALVKAPKSFAANYGLGVVLSWQGQYAAALSHLNAALSTQPNAADAHFYRLGALRAQERFAEAEKAGEAALARLPGNAKLLSAHGSLYAEQRRKDRALAYWEQSLVADRHNDYIRSHVLLAHHETCDWQAAEPHLAYVETMGLREQTTDPFVLLSLDGDPTRTLQRSQKVAEKMQAGLPARSVPAPPPNRPARLRLGFFSADFQTHPVGLLLIEIVERLRADQFDLVFFETGEVAEDAVNARFRAASAEYHPCKPHSLSGQLETARAAQLDVAFDLGGHSKGGRLELFCCGIAPIQIAYLGYPATTGAAFMDYLLSDAVVTPPDRADLVTEAPLLLPGCFMPMGALPELVPTARADHGLPEGAFVFASFNKANKITQEVFAAWMQVLDAVPNAVLWMADLGEEATANLRGHAGNRAERLIFAPRTETTQEHISRLALADLFLDSFVYGAHSTAIDALAAGLPLLTHCGPGFAARVGASLLTQIAVPELIAPSPEDYVALAIDLARRPARLADLRARVGAGRARLFAPDRYAEDFATAIELVYARYLSGQPPELTQVPPRPG